MDEFERLLYQGAAQPPPDFSAEEPPRPWKTPMNRICWGLALITITPNFWYLDTVLPAVGTVLLWLGLRSLRRENGGFRFAYRCAAVYAVLRFANIIALATPLDKRLASLIGLEWHSAAGTVPFYYVLRACAVQMLLVLAAAGLWQGLKGVFRDAGQKPRTGCAGALTALEALLIPLSAIGVTGWLLVGPLLALWVLLVRSLFQLSRSLDEAGYALAPAPVKVSDSLAAGLWLGALALAVAVLPFFFNRLPVESERGEPASAGQTELREELLDLGFPEEVLEELTDGEVQRFAGAYGVTAKGLDYSSGNYPDGIPHVVTVEVPVRDGHYGWRVAYLARLTWDQGMDGRMEGIRLRPDIQGVMAFLDGPEGTLRWEVDGETRTAPLEFRRADWMDYLCDFSLPEKGGQVTGYVFWSVVPTFPEKTSVYNYSIGLAHRLTAWQWPYTLPSQVLEDGGSRLGWRVFTALYTGHLAPEGKYESNEYD